MVARPRAPLEPEKDHGSGGDLPLFAATRIHGSDYVPALDRARLVGQLAEIHALIEDRQWRTLGEIRAATGYGEASISAQLRNLRKAPHSMTIEKRRRGEAKNGCWEYRLGGA